MSSIFPIAQLKSLKYFCSLLEEDIIYALLTVKVNAFVILWPLHFPYNKLTLLRKKSMS